MNKIFKGLLATAIALSSNVIAKDHSNKTFLMPRPGGSVDLPMEHTSWDNFIDRANNFDQPKADKKMKNGKGHKKEKKGFGGNLNITGFYNESQGGSDLGKYFAPCGKAQCPPAQDCNSCCDGYIFSLQRKDSNFVHTNGSEVDNATPFATQDEGVDLGYIIHRSGFVAADNNNKTDKVTLGFDPEHNVAGIRFDYYQDLECILKGLFFRANLPIVNVENNVNFAVCSQDFATTKQAIQDYFRGTNVKIPFDISNSASNETNQTLRANQQEKLCKAKICGKQSESGVADIDLALGYKLLNKENYNVALAFAITIPTGNTPDGKWLFEPVVGNGGHFGIGFDVDGGVDLWENEDQNLKMYLRLKYRYLLEDCEHRVLGLGTDNANAPKCSTDSCSTTNCDTKCPTERPWGHYTLLGCKDRVDLRPAANVLCQSVDVTPGSQFDGIIGLNYNYEGFNFDLGYNLYYREEEDVKIKGSKNDCNTTCNVTCPDLSIYSVAARGHYTAVQNIANNFQAPANGADGVNAPFNQEQLTVTASGATATNRPGHLDGNVVATAKLNDGTKVLTSVAQTPSQLTHSIYGGVAYAFIDWDYPVLLRLGAKYEWKDDNASIERFGIWGGVGVGF